MTAKPVSEAGIKFWIIELLSEDPSAEWFHLERFFMSEVRKQNLQMKHISQARRIYRQLHQRRNSPIASPPIATESVVPLPALWERTIAHTKVASAKALFSQQAHLVALQGKQAIVGVRPSLFKLAEGKVQPLQDALSQVLGYAITVKLQPADSPAKSA